MCIVKTGRKSMRLSAYLQDFQTIEDYGIILMIELKNTAQLTVNQSNDVPASAEAFNISSYCAGVRSL